MPRSFKVSIAGGIDAVTDAAFGDGKHVAYMENLKVRGGKAEPDPSAAGRSQCQCGFPGQPAGRCDPGVRLPQPEDIQFSAPGLLCRVHQQPGANLLDPVRRQPDEDDRRDGGFPGHRATCNPSWGWHRDHRIAAEPDRCGGFWGHLGQGRSGVLPAGLPDRIRGASAQRGDVSGHRCGRLLHLPDLEQPVAGHPGHPDPAVPGPRCWR